MLAGDFVRDQGLSGITANLFADNKTYELNKPLSALEWTQLSTRLMEEDFNAIVNVFNGAGSGSVDVSLDVDTIRTYHAAVFAEFQNLPPQTWTAYTPTLVAADANALWAEILAAQSFWGQLDSGLGVMGDVIAATPTVMQPAYYVLAVQINLGSPIGQLGKLAAQSVADAILQGNAALAHEWLDDMLFDGVGIQALLQASPQGFAEATDALIDSLGFGKPLTGVADQQGTNAAELILGGEGAEVISGGAGHDVIYAEALQSYLLGTFPEEETWTTGGDAIDGGEGVDTILGGAGHDFLIDDVVTAAS